MSDTPSQNGSFPAYIPEWRETGTDWRAIETYSSTIEKGGVATPRAFSGIHDTIGVYGYEQAAALAWSFAASAQASSKTISIRLRVLSVNYEIKTTHNRYSTLQEVEDEK